jgi:hypothetical protein
MNKYNYNFTHVLLCIIYKKYTIPIGKLYKRMQFTTQTRVALLSTFYKTNY